MGQTLSSDYSNVEIVDRSLSSKQPCFLAEPLGQEKSQSSLEFIEETDEEKSLRLENLARKSSGSCMKDRIDYLIEGYLLSNKPLESLSVPTGHCKTMETNEGHDNKEACSPLETSPNEKAKAKEKLSPEKKEMPDTDGEVSREVDKKRIEGKLMFAENSVPQNGETAPKSENVKPNLTLQTFIDKVLDTSLNSVEKTEMDSKTSADPTNNSSCLGAKNKNIDNALKMPKAPENRGRMSLQDRIEQVLEQTFNAHPLEDDKETKKQTTHKTSATKNSTDSAFNPQDLVDKMINQSEVINKLLSPSKEHFVEVKKTAGDLCIPEKNHTAVKKGFIGSSTENSDEKHSSMIIKEEMPLKNFPMCGNKESLSCTFTGPAHSETKYVPISVEHSSYQNIVPGASRHNAAVSPPVVDTRQFYPTIGVPNHFTKKEHSSDSSSHLLSINRPYHMTLSPGGSGSRKMESAHNLSDCRCVGCQSKTGHISLEKSPTRSPLAGHNANGVDRHYGLPKPYNSSANTTPHFHKSIEHGSVPVTVMSHFHRSPESGSVPAMLQYHRPTESGSLPATMSYHRPTESGSLPATMSYHRSTESGSLPATMSYHRPTESGSLPASMSYHRPTESGSLPASMSYHRPTESGSLPATMSYHRSTESGSLPTAIPYHRSPENIPVTLPYHRSPENIPVTLPYRRSPESMKHQDLQRLSAPTYFPPAVMPLTISTSPHGHASRFPYMAQLVPSNPPIPSPKEYQNQQLSPTPASFTERIYQQMSTSPGGVKEGVYPCPPVPCHSSQDVWKQQLEKSMFKKEAVSLRPSSVPSDQPNQAYAFSKIASTWKKPDSAPVLDLSVQKPPFSDQRTEEDQPLDLSCSKVPEHEHNQSKAPEQETWLPPKSQPAVNTHLRYLEKSVDKYCQNPSQLSGAPVAMNTNPLSERFASVNDHVRSRVTASPSHEQNTPTSQHGSLHPPYNNHPYQNSVPLSYQSHMHSAPSKTSHMVSHVTNSKPNTLLTNVPIALSKPSNSGNPAARSDSVAKQTRRAGVSKHEPIQNIIGHHNPADILYLICRLCDQTYGSPYGFRKHFRNQHGFEPRADHTVVQTISATKTALRNPIETVSNPPLQTVTSSALPSSARVVAPLDEKNVQRFKNVLNEKLGIAPKPNCEKNVENSYPAQSNINQLVDSSRTVENRSEENVHFNSSKTSELRDGEERKCLTCPECHQAFQLNDFGSYKRHCRQHSHSRYPGPFQCTECSLSFSEHHLYKEHVAGHYASSLATACKQCNTNFTSAAFLHEHLQAVHPETLLVNCRTFGNSHTDNLPQKSQENISEPRTTAADGNQTAEKNALMSSRFDPTENRANKIIPSQHVQKLPAESATISASPDSSSEIVSVTSCGDVVSTVDSCVGDSDSRTKVDNRGSTNLGSAASGGGDASLNDNSANMDTDLKRDLQTSNIETSSQNSSDSFSLADPDNKDQGQISYKHKKFCSNRKRKDSMPTSSETTSIKSPKLSSSGNESESSLGMESMKSTMDYSPSTGSYEPVDSTRENLSKESDTDSLSESGHEGDRTDEDSKNSKLVLKIKCGSGNNNNNSVKNEARHQLPFVWDRITRRQAGKNIRPPKYH